MLPALALFVAPDPSLERVAFPLASLDRFVEVRTSVQVRSGRHESRSAATEHHASGFDLVEGFAIDFGWLSPAFATSESGDEALLDDALVLISRGAITDPGELQRVFALLDGSGRALLLVAPEVSAECLDLLVDRHRSGLMRCCAVAAPADCAWGRAVAEDVTLLTGASHYSPAATLVKFGSAAHVVVDGHSTRLIGGGGDQALIEIRIAEIRRVLTDAANDAARRGLQHRLTRLTGGLALMGN